MASSSLNPPSPDTVLSYQSTINAVNNAVNMTFRSRRPTARRAGIRSVCAVGAILAACLALSACQTLSNIGYRSQSTLSNTYWRLTRVAGIDVRTVADTREPFLLLTGSEHTVEGFGGCNNLQGSYRRDQKSLVFSVRAATRLSCSNLTTLERRFIAALNHTRSTRIDKDRLTLLNADGQPLARFRARLME